MRSQAERTAQAWTRTALAVVGLVLWCFHLEVEEGGPAVLLAVLALLAAAAFTWFGQYRTHQLRTMDEPPPLPRSSALVVAASVVVIDVAGLALAFRL